MIPVDAQEVTLPNHHLLTTYSHATKETAQKELVVDIDSVLEVSKNKLQNMCLILSKDSWSLEALQQE